jgi:glycosyltransferase involved in cell wall biosynthesis
VFTGLLESNIDRTEEPGLDPLPDPLLDGEERPLRIAMVVPPYFEVPPRAYGGVESVVADLTDALVERGHDVTLIGAGQTGTSAKLVSVWPLPIPERLGEPMPEILHAALTREAVRDLAAGPGIDIVHEHTCAGPLNAWGYAAMGLPTVVTMHGPVDEDLSRFYRAVGSDIDLVAISDRQRHLAPSLNWAGRVHNAVRTETFPFRADHDGYALFLGRFHPHKAPHLALDAAHAAGLPLVLAGKCAEPIEKAYFASEVEPRLTATDEIFGEADADEKRRLLAGARCLLMPVRWEEPFGMVMIEAMACGTPVIALRGGAVPEIVVDGVTGFVLDDPSELPGAIARLDEIDPEACRARVAEHFDVTGLGAGYEAVYRDVLRARALTGDPIRLLEREYGYLGVGLDRRFTEGRRLMRTAGGAETAPAEPPADRKGGVETV